MFLFDLLRLKFVATIGQEVIFLNLDIFINGHNGWRILLNGTHLGPLSICAFVLLFPINWTHAQFMPIKPLPIIELTI